MALDLRIAGAEAHALRLTSVPAQETFLKQEDCDFWDRSRTLR